MTAKLRVLMITGEYPPMEGGVADFTAIIAERLVRRDHDVHVLTARQAANGRDEDHPVTVHADMDDWGFKPLYRRLRELVAAVRPDVINIQYQTAAFGMHPAINLLPRFFPHLPVVVTFHDLRVPFLLPKAVRLRRWVNVDLARMADAVIVTNAQDRADLQQVGRIKRMETIPIGSNISYQLPDGYDRGMWRGQWGVDARTNLLSFFGFLNDSKGAVELVQALGILRDRGMRANLMMIGGAVSSSNASNQDYYDLVLKTIDTLDLQDMVFWTGYVPNEQVSAAFKSSDVCVLPFTDGASFRRGSLMAALTHGTAIVSTEPQVSVPELIHRQNMYLVPPADAEAVARAVQDIAANPALRHRLEQGAEELSRLFDWEVISDRTVGLFNEVVAARGAPSGVAREEGKAS